MYNSIPYTVEELESYLIDVIGYSQEEVEVYEIEELMQLITNRQELYDFTF